MYCVGTNHNLGIYDINTDVMGVVPQPWDLKMVAFDRNNNFWCVGAEGNVGVYGGAAPLLSDDEKLRLLVTDAPRVWLADGEKYHPSSAEFAFRFLERFRDHGD